MTKYDLRKQFKERRRVLTALEVAEQSEAIAQRFFGFFDVGLMTAVHSYLPISQQNEVNTLVLLNVIHDQYPQTQIAVPRVIPNTTDLEHYLWTPDIKLTQNQWHILETNFKFQTPLSIIHYPLIIVPLLAYDHSGNRVGYGKGYYDRFLAQCSPNTIKVGLSFFEPVQLVEDVNQHDVRLDYCVTPTKVWVFD
jgi:5-formyltetrahydrofolate cyclo-ligase